MPMTLNSKLVQDEIVRISLRHLHQVLEHQESQFVGLNIDYDNAIGLTLSSDAATSFFLGQPKPVPHLGTEYPFFTKPLGATSAHLYAIRFSRWSPRGLISLNIILKTSK